MTRPALLSALARRIAETRAPHPVRVAIDGVDGAGKTTLADELAPQVQELGRPVVRSSVDFFHNPAELRYRRGRKSAEGYYRDSFDLEALRTRLLDPLGPGGDCHFRARSFDYRTDRAVEAPLENAPGDAVLLFDGVFLQRPELRGCFEIAIFLEVPFEETVARMVKRDGAPPELEDPGNQRYVGGQRIYLRECDPAGRADLLVDNTDLASPRILRDTDSR